MLYMQTFVSNVVCSDLPTLQDFYEGDIRIPIKSYNIQSIHANNYYYRILALTIFIHPYGSQIQYMEINNAV